MSSETLASALSSALAPASTLTSFFSSGVDLASKVYEFSLVLHEAKTVDKVGVHIGPVIRQTSPAGEWLQKLLLVFHRAVGGDTVKHHYNIDMRLTGNSNSDKHEQWSVKLEQIQSTIMDQLDPESVKQVFDAIRAQAKRSAAADATPATPAAPDKSDSKSQGPSDVVAAAATAVNNLTTLEKSFDSRRTVALSRIGYVADSMLGAKVPEEDHWYEKTEVEKYCEKVKNLFASALFEIANVEHELRTYDAKKRYIDLIIHVRILDGNGSDKEEEHKKKHDRQ